MVETYVCFLKIIHIFFFKKLNILTRSNVNRELVPLFHCRDCKSPSSLSFTRVFRASQGYASMPRLSRRNIINPCQCIGQRPAQLLGFFGHSSFAT